MNPILRLALSTSLLLAASTAAWSAPVITTPLRLVAVGDNSGTLFGPHSPDGVTGVFSDSVSHVVGAVTPQTAAADQVSALLPAAGLFKGNGHASIGFSVRQIDGPIAESDYRVSFSLPQDAAYSLAGYVDAASDGGVALGAFVLTGPDSLDLETSNGLLNLASGGVLHAGDYLLDVTARMFPKFPVSPGSFMGGHALYDFTFSLTDLPGHVPEPGSVFLAAIALLALVGVRRGAAQEHA